jgi:ABC-type nitrate/sulfonate/bicarbonate transport system permease component
MQANSALPLLIRSCFLVLVLFLWYAATTFGHISPLLIPKPVDVFWALVDLVHGGDASRAIAVTFSEVVIAFLVSAIIGLIAGFFIGRSPYLIAVLSPLVSGLYAIPAILFFPLYILFFGIGIGSKIALGMTISFFPIVISTIAGFGSVDKTLLNVARTMGARGWPLFRFVLLPASFPVVFSGLRMGFVLAFLSVLGGETIASFSGIGHEIAGASESMDSVTMYAFIVLAITASAAVNMTLSRLERLGVRG